MAKFEFNNAKRALDMIQETINAHKGNIRVYELELTESKVVQNNYVIEKNMNITDLLGKYLDKKNEIQIDSDTLSVTINIKVTEMSFLKVKFEYVSSLYPVYGDFYETEVA